MYHRNYTTYLQKELDFLKLLISRFHEQEKVNGLELDVALQKTQEVYEQLLRIKITPEPEEAPLPVKVPELMAIPATAEVSAPEKIVMAKEKIIVKESPAPVQEEKNFKKEVSAPLQEEKKQQPEPAKAAILAEKITPSDFHPINETLAPQKTGADLSSKLQTAPLSSIASGIGLNDKFLYIRELFNGDNALYSNTIRNLDATDSLKDALDYVHRNFDWDEKNDTVQKFIALVYRRHGNN